MSLIDLRQHLSFLWRLFLMTEFGMIGFQARQHKFGQGFNDHT